MPKKGFKTITVPEPLFQKLKGLAQERGKSVPDLLRDLFVAVETLRAERKISIPRCKATKLKGGKTFYIECEDGKKAIVPEKFLPELASRYGLVLELG